MQQLSPWSWIVCHARISRPRFAAVKRPLIALLLTLAGVMTGSPAFPQEMGARTAPNQFVTVGDGKIAFRTFGQGSPVIFLQRFRGTMDDWDPAFVDTIASRHRVILFDSPGVSLSTGQVPATIAGMADEAVRFAKAVGVEKADFIGWSMGGMIAQALLVRHPDVVDHAVLMGTTPPAGTTEQFPPPSEDVRKVAGKPAYVVDDHLYLFFAPSESSKRAGRAYFERLAARVGPPSPPVTQEAWAKGMLGAVNDWYMGADGLAQGFKTINRPVLVVNGNQDIFFPAIQSFVLAREIPTAQLVLYPDSGHGFMFQYPEAFGKLVLDFLQHQQ